MKVADLDGPLLGLWVARANGWRIEREAGAPLGLICYDDKDNPASFGPVGYCPYENWAQGGPIIDREIAAIDHPSEDAGFEWHAISVDGPCGMWGHTALIAAMRAHVAAKFGDTVPDEAP